MYSLLHEITFIHPSKARPNPTGELDLPIYERGLNGERVFTFDGTPSQYDTESPKRYGIGYIRPDGQLCVVPDIWDETDAMIGHNSVFPDYTTACLTAVTFQTLSEQNVQALNLRKAQIQAWEAQAVVIKVLRDKLRGPDDGNEREDNRALTNAQDIIASMEAAGYAPRLWGVGLAARWETGDETPEQIAEYDSAEWGGGM